ncbi:MAG TPA: tannase/feruloyl esterase family alpha/beta hydrolase [Croceibacterium sp.]|jgi:feruloyl esterase
MKRFAAFATVLLAGCIPQHEAAGPPALASAVPQPGGRCAAMVGRDFGPGIAISDASMVAAAAPGTVQNGPARLASALPAYCSVKGVIDQRTGAGGKTYGIRFNLALPYDWSGRFLLMGGGGLNGSVAPPIGPVAAGTLPALARGFAVVSHDSGHEGAVFDDSFSKDQRAALDFAEASVRTVTLAAKAITAAYYGQPIAHSYMTGCSTGGREGMLAIERYPELFDGVVIGAPAMRTGDSNLGIEYTQVLLNRISPIGGDGRPDVSLLLTADVRKTLVNGMLDQCDALDGLKDGMIENVAACHFNPAKLVCAKGQTGGCIGQALADTLKTAFAGPRDGAGYPIYAPVPFDTGTVATPMGYLPSGAPGPFGPPSKATTIDLEARIHAIRADAMQRLTDTNYWTNLNTFLGHGGKTLFYHGVSDFWFSPLATWDWYQRAAQTNGVAFTDASRFYMVPGMLHCAGGNSFDQFDLLTKMVDWVEKGQAPHEVIASRRDGSATRPLCAYPSHAQYIAGDVTKAESFECRAPEKG